MTRILVVGGGGYIGSHMVKYLAQAGYAVTTLDNFSTGYRDAIRAGTIVEGDLGDAATLQRLFASQRIHAVIHFAALNDVEESTREPECYYHNNVARTLTLLQWMRRHSIDKFIFSSSAAVYGEPSVIPIVEDYHGDTVNAYGRSKKYIEEILIDYDRAYALRSASLRYFNAAGADLDGELGERHDSETHLIPLVLGAALGHRDNIRIYGDDYDTDDGTCVRDFVHVQDLCAAHECALRYLLDDGATDRFNLGSGRGYSVHEVVDTVRQITGRDFSVDVLARRPGDPAYLVAATQKAREQLSWAPQYGLDDMIHHALVWHGPGASRESSLL